MYEREEPRITSARDPVEHATQRRALSHAFSARALRDQEDVVHKYVDLLVQQLGNLGDNGRKGVNVTDAYNWLTFDVIGLCIPFLTSISIFFPFSFLSLHWISSWMKTSLTFHQAILPLENPSGP